jgi:signal transduction histidine kinase
MAHDLRNLLATVGLHIETLQRLSGPGGARAASAAHALLSRGATLCNVVLDRAASGDGRAGRKGVDPMQIARQVADLLAPTAPKDFSFDIEQTGAASALADPEDVFRILFNLMSNAVAVANCAGASLRTVKIRVENEDSSVLVKITDDGPGLPAGIRKQPFARQRGARHGYGLVIARELSERNGGTLALAPTPKGTAFVLRLPAFLSVLAQDERLRPSGDALCHLGRRAMAL